MKKRVLSAILALAVALPSFILPASAETHKIMFVRDLYEYDIKLITSIDQLANDIVENPNIDDNTDYPYYAEAPASYTAKYTADNSIAFGEYANADFIYYMTPGGSHKPYYTDGVLTGVGLPNNIDDKITVYYQKAPSYRLVLDYYDSAAAETPAYSVEQGTIIGTGLESGIGGTSKWLNAVPSSNGNAYFADLSAYQTDATYAGSGYSYVSSERHFLGGDRNILEGSSCVINGDDFSTEIHIKYVKNALENTPTYETTSTGETFSYGVYNYKITSLSPYTAEVTGAVDKSLTSVNVPARVSYHSYSFTVTAIGGGAFMGCKELLSATINEDVTIGANAFRDCTELLHLDIKKGAKKTAIGANAFHGCTSLSRIEIPASVDLIGGRAFYGCIALDNITIKSEDVDLEIEPSAFYGINSSAVFKGVPLTRYTELSEGNSNWDGGYTYVSLTGNADSINAAAADENGDNIVLKSDPIGFAQASEVLKKLPGSTFGELRLSTNTLTFGDMAKMLAVVSNGGELPSLDVSTAGSNGDWAEGYINYCAESGIIAGNGDGRFAPNRPVTGSEAARMLLVALGYDNDLTGAASADGTCGIVDMGKGNYGVIIGAANISAQDGFAGSADAVLSVKISKEISRLVNISDAMIVHGASDDISELIEFGDVKTTAAENSGEIYADFAQVMLKHFSPFVIVAPLKAEYAEALNAAFASVSDNTGNGDNPEDGGDKGENPVTSAADFSAFILLTGICAASTALVSKKKH